MAVLLRLSCYNPPHIAGPLNTERRVVSRPIFRFGLFEVDIRGATLTRKGARIKIQDQPFRALVLLLEHPGEIVTREELRRQLWPKNTFVDFDAGLNAILKKLRNAIDDDPDNPRFIETVPRRGYRFLATVDKICPEQVQNSEALPPTDEKSLAKHKDQPHVRLRLGCTTRLVLYSAAGGVLLLVLFISGFKFRSWSVSQLAVKSFSPLTSDGREKGGLALFSDGARVYFSEIGPNGPTLASVAVQGGATGIVPFSLHDTSIYDLSPLRSEVLAGRLRPDKVSEDLWMIPLFGGPPRRVGTARTRSATFSPDRSQIASIDGKELHLMKSDGTQPRKIANVPESSTWLRWSPDGKKLRFTSSAYRNGDAQSVLWEIAADGTNLHQLLADWHYPPQDCCGSWTADGSYYVFQSMRNGHTDLWALPERLTLFTKRAVAPVQLSSGLEFSQPLVSNDGKYVFAVGAKRQGELVRYDSVVHEFVKFLGGISATWVTFSKSGRRVAYLDYPRVTLWSANPDGSEKRQLTFTPFETDGYSWSPDEQTLAVRGRNPGSVWRIYLVRSTGGDPEPLMAGEKEHGVPTWSADGTRLCFGDVPTPFFGKPGGNEAIHIFNLGTHQLSDLPRSQGLWTSRWSPDGRYISALTINSQKLMLFDFTRNAWRATDATEVNNPNWSNDGKYIYYDTEGNNRELRRVRVSDGSVELITSLREYPNLAWWWSGLTPSNDPLVLRSLGTSEIYSLALEHR